MCRYWLEEGCTRKKECQYLHTDVGKEYSSSSSRSLEREVNRKVSNWQKSENEENKTTVQNFEKCTKDSNSSFDFALLELSDTEDVEKETTGQTESYIQCNQCQYKCKQKSLFRSTSTPSTVKIAV